MSCCPSTFWCTPSGVVSVEADANGDYTPPAEATSGPYDTREEALAVCPTPPQELEMCCEEPIQFPRRVTFYIINKTGVYVDNPFYPDEWEFDLEASSACSATSCFWPQVPNVGPEVQLFCTPLYKYVSVAWRTCANTVTLSGSYWGRVLLPYTPGDPSGGYGRMFIHDYTCGEDISATGLNAHPHIGTYHADPASCGGSGSFDLYAVWE